MEALMTTPGFAVQILVSTTSTSSGEARTRSGSARARGALNSPASPAHAPAPSATTTTTMGHTTSLPVSNLTTTTNNVTNTFNDNSTGEYFPNYWPSKDDLWNNTYFINDTANYTSFNISDYELNINNTSVQYGFWFCAKWVEAQQDLFQAANLCFAVAFLIPKSFKQSILAMRALVATGFLLLAAWAGTELCAPDVLAWNLLLFIINSVHTGLLVVRFLPPSLSLELTELYLKLFKPLKVSKKHFKELTREARLLRLEPGEPYAVEGITPADERLSILLKGRLKVSCSQTLLHHIHPHQFMDSPEWEANHEQSDDVFQVTVLADDSCTYLCWPRMRLERVLRHRPMLKIVLDSIIGKDITHKLYSLNEQLAMSSLEVKIPVKSAEAGSGVTRAMLRSLSADAVDVGARGRVRSLGWRARALVVQPESFSPARAPQQQWRPVASQFPPESPFTGRVRPPTALPLPPAVGETSPIIHAQLLTQNSSSSLPFPSSRTPLLSPPPKRSLRKTASFRKNREVKFAEPHESGL